MKLWLFRSTGAMLVLLTMASAVPAIAMPINYSNTNVTVAARDTQTFSLFGAGLFDASDDFTANGTFVITPPNGVEFNPLFLLTDGNNYYGGEVNDNDPPDTNTDILASANRGVTINTAATNGGTVASIFGNFANVSTPPTPVTVKFKITNETSGAVTTTTSTVTFDGNSGSIFSAASGFTLDPSLGFSLALANLESGAGVTFDSIDISILVPEPVAAWLLAGTTLACLGRRRSA